MDSNEFIKSIKVGVENSTFNELHSLLENPPGRSPDKLNDELLDYLYLNSKGNQVPHKGIG